MLLLLLLLLFYYYLSISCPTCVNVKRLKENGSSSPALGRLSLLFFYPFQTSAHRLKTQALKGNQVLLLVIQKVCFKSHEISVVMATSANSSIRLKTRILQTITSLKRKPPFKTLFFRSLRNRVHIYVYLYSAWIGRRDLQSWTKVLGQLYSSNAF